MFKTGQRVRHRVKAITGTILEVDGTSAYIETEEGVEMQFALADLQDDTIPALSANSTLVEDPKYAKVLALMPEGVLGQATMAYVRSPGNPRDWATAPARRKLDWVQKVTGLTFTELSALATSGKAKQIEAHAAVASRKAR